MKPYHFSSVKCYKIVDILDSLSTSGKESSKYLSSNDIMQLLFSCQSERVTENSDRYSEPMVWIGMYIAVASFCCILAMVADLLHGFRNKKFWFPCKYFSLNAASITVITVSMKLPVDLSSAMPSYMDQATKVGSLAFMCTMMSNLMPSLASTDNKTLLANVIGLCIILITMTVNICIQINTGVINNIALNSKYLDSYFGFAIVAYIYMAIILLLLIIMISSSLTIPTSKEILESKYQATNKIFLSSQRLQHIQMSTVEKLRKHVRRYWVMADTGNPQFVMASNPLSTASGVICVIVLVINSFMVFKVVYHDTQSLKKLVAALSDTMRAYGSPYKWSIIVIFITQSVGVAVGTIAPIFRCFSAFSFKLVTKWNKNRIMFFKVERYWIQKLHEWKLVPVPFLLNNRRARSLTYDSKNIILSICIGFQMVIIVTCKLIWLTATIFPILIVNCLYRWKSFTVTSRTDNIDEDLSICILQIDNEVELVEKTLKGISNTMDSFIMNASKGQNNNLLELLKKSNGFKGVEIFEADQVQPLLPVELVNNWSLPVVTLTCIAVALPNIPKDIVGSLFKSVGEGLSYTHFVEESLNCASEYVNLRKASMALWHEVENKLKWLDIPLAKSAFKGKTVTYIIKWFSDKAKEIVREINESTNGELMENPPKKMIAANSMYKITQTILLRLQSNIEPITKKQLFAHLNGMIADIFSACFTNIPRVITIKCHENVIEKREASVKVAAKLLGKTTKIIETLETLELPSLDEDKMAYIDEWRLCMKQSIP